MFEGIPGVSFVDVSSNSGPSKTSALRELAGHIAVDLSGWTGGHHATAFMARVAPVQINYLGYHASTGIPDVDYWLGDCALFPKPMGNGIVRKYGVYLVHFWPGTHLHVLLRQVLQSLLLPPSCQIWLFQPFSEVSDNCLAVWANILIQS